MLKLVFSKASNSNRKLNHKIPVSSMSRLYISKTSQYMSKSKANSNSRSNSKNNSCSNCNTSTKVLGVIRVNWKVGKI